MANLVGNKAKGRILKWVFQEKIACQIFEKQTSMCISGVKEFLFCRKFGVLYFLGTPILRLALLLYYRRSQSNGTLHGSFLQDQ